MSQETRMQTGHLPQQHCYCIKSGFTSQLPDNEHLARVYFLQTTKYTQGIKRDDSPCPSPRSGRSLCLLKGLSNWIQVIIFYMVSYFLCLFNVSTEICIFKKSSAHIRKETKIIFFPKQRFWREKQNSIFSVYTSLVRHRNFQT